MFGDKKDSSEATISAQIDVLEMFYRPVFEAIVNEFGSNSEIGRKCSKASNDIETVSKNIRFYSRNNLEIPRGTERTLKSLLLSIEDTKNQALFFMRKSKARRETLDRIFSESHVLSNDLSINLKSKSPAQRKSFLTSLVKYSILGGAVSQIAAPILGPAFGPSIAALAAIPVATKAVGAIGRGAMSLGRASFNLAGVINKGHDRVSSKLQQSLSSLFQSSAADKGISSEEMLSSAAKTLGSKTATPKEKSIASRVMAEVRAIKKGDETKEFSKSTEDGLEKFYSKKALKTAWTRDTLKYLKKIAEKGGTAEEGKSLFSKVSDFLGLGPLGRAFASIKDVALGLVKGLGSAIAAFAPAGAIGLAIAAAAGSIWFLNKRIKEEFGSWKEAGKSMLELAKSPFELAEAQKRASASSSLLKEKTETRESAIKKVSAQAEFDVEKAATDYAAGKLNTSVLKEEEKFLLQKYLRQQENKRVLERQSAVDIAGKAGWKKGTLESLKPSNWGKGNLDRGFDTAQAAKKKAYEEFEQKSPSLYKKYMEEVGSVKGADESFDDLAKRMDKNSADQIKKFDELIKATEKNKQSSQQTIPRDTRSGSFDSADPLINQMNLIGSPAY